MLPFSNLHGNQFSFGYGEKRSKYPHFVTPKAFEIAGKELSWQCRAAQLPEV